MLLTRQLLQFVKSTGLLTIIQVLNLHTTTTTMNREFKKCCKQIEFEIKCPRLGLLAKLRNSIKINTSIECLILEYKLAPTSFSVRQHRLPKTIVCHSATRLHCYCIGMLAKGTNYCTIVRHLSRTILLSRSCEAIHSLAMNIFSKSPPTHSHVLAAA